MDINKICTACNIKIDKHNYSKWTIVCGGCYNKNKRMYHIEKQSPNNNEMLCMNPITTEHSS